MVVCDMAASARFESTSTSWSEAYMNGKRGGGGLVVVVWIGLRALQLGV